MNEKWKIFYFLWQISLLYLWTEFFYYLIQNLGKYKSLHPQEAAKRVGEELVKACTDLDVNEISSYDRNGFSRGEKMQAFEIAISRHGFLSR